MEKKAVRTDTFRCPVCQEGEIKSETAEPVNDRIAKVLQGEPANWVVMLPRVETVTKS
jgi:hypothetical protein